MLLDERNAGTAAAEKKFSGSLIYAPDPSVKIRVFLGLVNKEVMDFFGVKPQPLPIVNGRIRLEAGLAYVIVNTVWELQVNKVLIEHLPHVWIRLVRHPDMGEQCEPPLDAYLGTYGLPSLDMRGIGRFMME